jgi:hypothetical protein
MDQGMLEGPVLAYGVQHGERVPFHPLGDQGLTRDD